MNKKVVLFSLLFAFVFSVFAQDKFKPGSEPKGFRGKTWGTDISAFSGMEATEFPGQAAMKKLPGYTPPTTPANFSQNLYVKKNDILRFAGVKIDEINYIFNNNKLSGVMVTGSGQETYEKLKEKLSSKYGEAKASFPSGSYFGGCAWLGETTNIMLIFMVGDVVVVNISSVKNEKEAKRKAVERRGPFTREMQGYGRVVWNITSDDSRNAMAGSGGTTLYTYQDAFKHYKPTERTIKQYTKEKWSRICDQQDPRAGNPVGRSNQSECNAVGALCFEDISFCDKLPYIKNSMVTPDIRTKCVTVVAIKKNDKSLCTRATIDSEFCKARFDQELIEEFPDKTSFKYSIGRNIVLPAGITLEMAKKAVDSIDVDEVFNEAVGKTTANPRAHKLKIEARSYNRTGAIISVMVYYSSYGHTEGNRIAGYAKPIVQKRIEEFLK